MAVTLRNYAFTDSGAPAIGAAVKAEGREEASEYSTTTNSAGMWEFIDLPDDVYDVSITVGGKKRLHMGDVSIQIGGFTDDTGGLPVGDGSITTAKIAPGAVTTTELADNSVTTAKIVAANVTKAKMASNSVGTSQIEDGAVTVAKIGSGAVGTAQIQNGSITADKLAEGVGGGGGGELADNSVTSAHIVNGTIATADIGNLQVTGAKIADGTVTEAKLATAVQDKLNASGGSPTIFQVAGLSAISFSQGITKDFYTQSSMASGTWDVSWGAELRPGGGNTCSLWLAVGNAQQGAEAAIRGVSEDITHKQVVSGRRVITSGSSWTLKIRGTAGSSLPQAYGIWVTAVKLA